MTYCMEIEGPILLDGESANHDVWASAVGIDGLPAVETGR